MKTKNKSLKNLFWIFTLTIVVILIIIGYSFLKPPSEIQIQQCCQQIEELRGTVSGNIITIPNPAINFCECVRGIQYNEYCLAGLSISDSFDYFKSSCPNTNWFKKTYE